MKESLIVFQPVEKHYLERIDKALTDVPGIESRSKASQLIQKGLVKLNGKPVKASYKINSGDVFEITIPKTEETQLSSYDFSLNIIYEDKDLLVVNKPSGLVVHPAYGHEKDTLVNALIHYGVNLSSGMEIQRPGIVHRLDKDTSGLIVVAKSEAAHRGLASQFKEKTVERTYKAVIYGVPIKNLGTIKSYLLRHPTDRKKYKSEFVSSYQKPKGKLAITHFKILKTHPARLSLVSCKLETGRTHQIRIHLSELGHPIVKDPIYCPKNKEKSVASSAIQNLIQQAPHLCLHAETLGFTHPMTSEKMLFKQTWPEELFSILKELDFYEA